MKKVNYITPQGFKKLNDEYQELVKIERPKITELVTWAASNGDRSENADYLYGKKKLREIDRRLRFLGQRIESACIVEPGSIQSNKIQFGATVDLLDENGRSKTYSIVGIDEIDTPRGWISWQSPIGNALLGKQVGDEVIIIVPQGELIFEIISIEFKILS